VVIAIGLAYGASRFGWIDRSPRLLWTLVGGYVLSNALALFSVWVTARLMFVNQHDLALAMVLLLFASGIAISLGYLLSVSLTRRITELNRAAKEVARGDLSVRVPKMGQDELAELARAFNQMAAQLEMAEQQQRELIALRQELVTWVGHDLRTPLTSIRVVIEALVDGVVEDPVTVERYLQTAQHHVQSLTQILDDLFEIARLEGGSIKLTRNLTSVRDLISDTIEAFSTLASRKGVRLEGDATPDVDPVDIDVPKIERVLANLVDNALRHTSDGDVVRVTASSAADGVQIVVRDTGAGIPPEDLPYVFERFYRGDDDRHRAAGSAGLGLAIAKGIVEAHGGEMGIESVVDEGTRVWFTLPT
jgi:signal transduction histidine kinase